MSGKTSETRKTGCWKCAAGMWHMVCESYPEPTPHEGEAVTEQEKTEVPPVMVGEGNRRDVHPAWRCYRMGWPKYFLLRVGEAENELTRAYDAIVQAQSIPAPVVSTAAPEPPDEICPNCQGVHSPKVVMSFVKPVAPESYKPAEGPRYKKGDAKRWFDDYCYDNGVNFAKRIEVGSETERFDELFPTMLDSFLERFFFVPAATPVTVEAPGKCHPDCITQIDYITKYSRPDLRGKPCDCGGATPKPIGDVEAAAKTLYEKGFRYEGPVIFACEFGVTAESAQIETITAILSPFFAPAGRISDKTLKAIVQDVAELPDRTSPDDWPEAMLVTAEELKAIISGNIEESAQPPCSECATLQGKLSAVVILLRARCSDKEWDAMPETLSEVLPAECATLRKERDDAEKAIAKALRFTPSEEEPEECAPWMVEAEPEPMGPFSLIEAITAMMEMFDREFSKADKLAEAAEARLSTQLQAFKDARDSLNDALDHLRHGSHENAIIYIKEGLKFISAALAPTPEVAPKK